MKRSLTPIHDFSSPEFAACMAILREAIPDSEQLPEGRFVELLSGNSYRLFSFGSGADVQAMAMVYFSKKMPFVLLDYMAVRSDLRGRGVGSELFREIVLIAQTGKPSADWLLLEVDDDREGNPQEREMNRRRVEFYRRLGARLLVNVPYCFPSPVGPPVPMRLMVRGLRSEAELSVEALTAAIADIFLNVHGRDSNDSVFQWFVSNRPESLKLS